MKFSEYINEKSTKEQIEQELEFAKATSKRVKETLVVFVDSGTGKFGGDVHTVEAGTGNYKENDIIAKFKNGKKVK